MKTIMKTILALSLLAMPVLAGAMDKNLENVLKASPQLAFQDGGLCSSEVIYSDRDKKSGEVKTVLLTAAHCVKDVGNQDIAVDFPVYKDNRVVKKDRYIGKALGTYFKADLGLIQLIDKNTLFESTVKLADVKPSIELDDATVVVGYPLGANLTVTHGNFVGYQTTNWPKDGTEYYRATPNMIFGDSGGGLYQVTKDGKYLLIGVNDGVPDPYTFMGLYVPIDQIRDYLKVSLPEAVGVVPVVTGAGK